MLSDLFERVYQEAHGHEGTWSLKTCRDIQEQLTISGYNSTKMFLENLDKHIVESCNTPLTRLKYAQLYSIVHVLNVPGLQALYDQRRMLFTNLFNDVEPNDIDKVAKALLMNTLAKKKDSSVKEYRRKSASIIPVMKRF